MPAVHAMRRSPPPPAPSAVPKAPGSPASPIHHQVGARQATRSRTRTRAAAGGGSRSSASRSRYSSEDHPLAPHKLAARGYHAFTCLGVPFHVQRRYTFLRELGIGAYGCVALARDSVLDINVAIKKVTRVFERDVLARRALREVAVLRHIGVCGNVTALLDFDTSFIEFNEIYLIMEASEADLSQIIRSGQALSDSHLQYFLAQILRGVRYMHAACVIHRDLKPGNLLVNADCQLKLCDFGLARAHAPAPARTQSSPASSDSDSEAHARREEGYPESPALEQGPEAGPFGNDASSYSVTRPAPPPPVATSRHRNARLNFPGGPLTEYVATRWYRAPEIMLCFKKGYGAEIDMWSVGCILAELIAGKPIFAGKDYVDQIARINNVLGSPPESTVAKIGSERAKTYVLSLPRMPAVPFSKLYPKASPQALDLLSKMLTWDPDERISAEEALQHPWLEAYYKSNAAWTPPEPFSRFDEVELITSIPSFRAGLEREGDEMRAELAALDAEEQREEERLRDAELAASANADRATQDEPAAAASRQSSSSMKATSSSSSCSASSRSRSTRPVSASSDASPMPTPSSPATSADTDAYETDPTSGSAPQSLSGARSQKGKAKARDTDAPRDARSIEEAVDRASQRLRAGTLDALDKSLAAHGMLQAEPGEVQAPPTRPTYRRRAVSNAPFLPREGVASGGGSSFLTLDDVIPAKLLAAAQVSGSFPTHRTDIIARPRLQHEDFKVGENEEWRQTRQRYATAGSLESDASERVVPQLSSASPRASDADQLRDECASRDGSDSTIGRPDDTTRGSPIPA